MADCILWRANADGPPVAEDLARVDSIHANQRACQLRVSGARHARYAKDFSSFEIERDIT